MINDDNISPEIKKMIETANKLKESDPESLRLVLLCNETFKSIRQETEAVFNETEDTQRELFKNLAQLINSSIENQTQLIIALMRQKND